MINRILEKLGSNCATKTVNRVNRSGLARGSRPLRHEPLEDRRMLATLTVNADWDGATNDDGKLMLREAIVYVNGTAPGEADSNQIDESEDFLGINDKIIFSTDQSDELDSGTITLGLDENGDPVNSPKSLIITHSVEIDARALTNGLTIEAYDPSTTAGDGTRVFDIVGGVSADVTLSGLTITGGDPGDNDKDGSGGGILFIGESGENTNSSLKIIDCVITGNHSTGNGGGIYASVRSNSGTSANIIISGSIISENESTLTSTTGAWGDLIGGGGVYLALEGSASITNTKFIANQSAESGGGLFAAIYHGQAGSNLKLTVDSSEFQLNKSHGSDDYFGGGGIYAFIYGREENDTTGTLELKNSTVSFNEASTGDGGGALICSKYGGAFETENSTFSGNKAIFGEGGGLWISRLTDVVTHLPQDTNLNHVTITNNYSPEGGGLYSAMDGGQAGHVNTTLKHTIVSGNYDDVSQTGKDNVFGRIETDSSFNLFGPTDRLAPLGEWYPLEATNGNKHDTDNDPGLMELAYYGGPTKTHMPEATSEVIDSGDPDAVPWPNGIPRYDQRGRPFDRVFYDGDSETTDIIDIGAVEYGIGDPTGAPRVVDIVISGTKSVHDDYSFSEAFDEGTHEFRTVPVGGADTIEIVFSEDVFSDDDATLPIDETNLYLRSGYSGINYNWTGDPEELRWKAVDFLYDQETFTARWRFDNEDDGEAPNPFPADRLAIYLNSSLTGYIYDADGNQLDGEWETPVGLHSDSPESFPSGDGVEEGAFCFTFVILPGDHDLDNDADGVGFLLWQLMYDPNGTDNTFTDGDFDGDGDVDGDDLAIWQANFGLNFTTWWS
jgi:putative extracellular protein